MKKLYSVYIYEKRRIEFEELEIIKETQTEYEVNHSLKYMDKDLSTKIPKNKLNKRLENGFITTNKRSKKLREEFNRLYSKLNNEFKDVLYTYTMQKEINDNNYAFYTEELKKLEN